MGLFGLGRRRWAIRILSEAGVSAGSQLGSELIEIILQGAKQFDEMAKSVGQRLSDVDVCLMSLGTAIRNETATTRLKEAGRLDDAALKELTYSLFVAAKYVCETENVSPSVRAFVYVGKKE